MKKFLQTPYKVPPTTPDQKEQPLEEKSLPFFKRRSKVRINPVIRCVFRRPELPMAPVQILEPIPESPVQIPHIPEPVQIPHVPKPPVQIPDVGETPVQIPPELDTLEPTDVFDQLISSVFGPPAQELQLLHTVPSILDGDLIPG
ncbi:hypothetical protein TNCV_499101 [Trichonephila clavipes]|nr:hypothetical protein TNCV_499101 [Trichonephila clavipes]